MFRNIMISALILGAGAAQAETKFVFELNEVVVQAPGAENASPLIYITQNDKSFTLQFVCNKRSSIVKFFDKVPLAAMTIPTEEESMGETTVDKMDCEKINKCAQIHDFNHNGRITVSIDTETEKFTIDSLSDSCKDI